MMIPVIDVTNARWIGCSRLCHCFLTVLHRLSVELVLVGKILFVCDLFLLRQLFSGARIILRGRQFLFVIILLERPFAIQQILELLDFSGGRDLAELGLFLYCRLFAGIGGVGDLFFGVQRGQRVSLVLDRQLLFELVNVVVDR
jgi:hypothetical protein